MNSVFDSIRFRELFSFLQTVNESLVNFLDYHYWISLLFRFLNDSSSFFYHVHIFFSRGNKILRRYSINWKKISRFDSKSLIDRLHVIFKETHKLLKCERIPKKNLYLMQISRQHKQYVYKKYAETVFQTLTRIIKKFAPLTNEKRY